MLLRATLGCWLLCAVVMCSVARGYCTHDRNAAVILGTRTNQCPSTATLPKISWRDGCKYWTLLSENERYIFNGDCVFRAG